MSSLKPILIIDLKIDVCVIFLKTFFVSKITKLEVTIHSQITKNLLYIRMNFKNFTNYTFNIKKSKIVKHFF